MADPSKFDYNDSFSEGQAGSPNKNSSYYPVGQLNLMDSTCWVAYNFEASGKELGGCYQLAPEPTKAPPTQTPLLRHLQHRHFAALLHLRGLALDSGWLPADSAILNRF